MSRRPRNAEASNESHSECRTGPQLQAATPIEINSRHVILSAAFLIDGKHMVSGDDKGNIQQWSVQDGKEVETAMEVGSGVFDIAVSQDGRLVSGEKGGWVTVWDMAQGNRKKVTAFKVHDRPVYVVDFSPDGTQVATGSADCTACVWCLSTRQRVLGPLYHDNALAAVKFSPDGRLLATATYHRNSVRISDSRHGRFLFEVQSIKIPGSLQNQFLAWTGDSKQLFVLSCDGFINCLDVSTQTNHFQWQIHSNQEARCIALARDGTFIAASAQSSVSLWDTTTHKQIGPLIHHTAFIASMDISANLDLFMCGERKITLRNLCDVLSSPYSDVISPEYAIRGQIDINESTETILAPEESLCRKNARLEETIQQLRNQLSDCQREVSQRDAAINERDLEIVHLQGVAQQLENKLSDLKCRADELAQNLHAHEQIHQCETLYAKGDFLATAASLVEFTKTVSQEVRSSQLIGDWFVGFTHRTASALEVIGDKASSTEDYERAVAVYSTALSLTPVPNLLFTKWARAALIRHPASNVLIAATEFKVPRFNIYRVVCGVLEGNGRIVEAVECFGQIQSELLGSAGDCNGETYAELCESQTQRSNATDSSYKTTTNMSDATEWAAKFKSRCLRALAQHGDYASHQDAIAHYTAVLILNPSSKDFLIRRSKARAEIGLWEGSLEDADAVIKLDPSSPHGYERRRAALLGTHCYDEAINAYDEMLLMLEQSPDPAVQELRGRYVGPAQTTTTIHSAVKRAQRDLPLVLINTHTGCLCDKEARSQQFEADPKFKELVASIMTSQDYSQITRDVQDYFRYATFSHTWEEHEPKYQDVLHTPLNKDKLATSPTVSKLVMFCTKAQEAGLLWAWSDTCCINKMDISVLRESLTAMFRWYHQSALTIVHLKGVQSSSKLRALIRCLWNTRAWTLQEFFASRFIRFYTEDWKLYCPQGTVDNHKLSSVIMDEMAIATGVDAHTLLSLRSGSEDVRQKLCLAASRIATKEEDIAYSLFGIFDVSIQANYGEGQEHALGRLLQEVLTRSGDVSILAWTGTTSKYNSCLPAEIGAYHEPEASFIPSPIEDVKMDVIVAELRTSLEIESAVELHDRIVQLPSPRLLSFRLSLSCIVFPLENPPLLYNDSQRIYRTATRVLGDVEIKMTENLPGGLILVHPWHKCLLDPGPLVENPIVDDHVAPPTLPGADGRHNNSDTHTHVAPHTAFKHDKPTRALRLFARLRQPFGALLLAHERHNEYKRIAPDQAIIVQLHKNVLPRHLVSMIRILDIL